MVDGPDVGQEDERFASGGGCPPESSHDEVGVDVDGEIDDDLKEPLGRGPGEGLGPEASDRDIAQFLEVGQGVAQGAKPAPENLRIGAGRRLPKRSAVEGAEPHGVALFGERRYLLDGPCARRRFEQPNTAEPIGSGQRVGAVEHQQIEAVGSGQLGEGVEQRQLVGRPEEADGDVEIAGRGGAGAHRAAEDAEDAHAESFGHLLEPAVVGGDP